jgi:hypothetical protein
VSSEPDPKPPGSSPESSASASSGSIDVAVSANDGVPAAVPAVESQRIVSAAVPGVVATATPREESSPTKRLSDAAKHVVEEGVSKLGSGIESLGGGVSRIGEASKNVPLVGSNISRLGEGISSVGESITDLPRVARTRRGRLLVRSLVVGFLLVAVWIAVIVGLQVRGTDAPDFRPNAERILAEISRGGPALDELYEQASPRFQEVVRKERFIDEMTDLIKTLGKFKEITSINETLVTTGPTGRIGRISLGVAFDKATTRGSISLHWDEGRWKLLGVGIEVPPELKPTQADREQRVQACKDPMDAKRCDLHVLANHILEQLRDGHADQVWDDASEIFQRQEEKNRFVQIQLEQAAVLGEYRRIIRVTEAKQISGGTYAVFDVLTEYAKTQGVRVVFGFYRPSKTLPWRLRSFKRVLPMPRSDDLATAGTVAPPALPPPAVPPTQKPIAPAAPAAPGQPRGAIKANKPSGATP